MGSDWDRDPESDWEPGAAMGSDWEPGVAMGSDWDQDADSAPGSDWEPGPDVEQVPERGRYADPFPG